MESDSSLFSFGFFTYLMSFFFLTSSKHYVSIWSVENLMDYLIFFAVKKKMILIGGKIVCVLSCDLSNLVLMEGPRQAFESIYIDREVHIEWERESAFVFFF